MGRRKWKKIDDYPSAWCAIEMAVLDLLSRERGCSVEKMLGLDDGKLCGRYTAVLGDEKNGNIPRWQINI